jgi:hypothetical protein
MREVSPRAADTTASELAADRAARNPPASKAGHLPNQPLFAVRVRIAERPGGETNAKAGTPT